MGMREGWQRHPFAVERGKRYSAQPGLQGHARSINNGQLRMDDSIY